MKNHNSAMRATKKSVAPTEAAIIAVLEKEWTLEPASEAVLEDENVDVGFVALFVGVVAMPSDLASALIVRERDTE
jgi:hypothetical protein